MYLLYGTINYAALESCIVLVKDRECVSFGNLISVICAFLSTSDSNTSRNSVLPEPALSS